MKRRIGTGQDLQAAQTLEEAAEKVDARGEMSEEASLSG
jgi:hypothetical protein